MNFQIRTHGIHENLNPTKITSYVYGIPDGSSIYCQNQEDGYGGIFIACQEPLTSC